MLISSTPSPSLLQSGHMPTWIAAGHIMPYRCWNSPGPAQPFAALPMHTKREMVRMGLPEARVIPGYPGPGLRLAGRAHPAKSSEKTTPCQDLAGCRFFRCFKCCTKTKICQLYHTVTAWAIPRALWAAPAGAAWYNQLWRVINNKPFQCSDGCDSPQQRRTAARVEQGDLFKFYEAQQSWFWCYISYVL